MQAAGSFDLYLSGISDDTWILVSATGGWDIDANDDGTVDASPVRNQGTLHALAKASQWRKNHIKVNALTDMAWRYSQAWVGQASLAELEKRLNDVARTLLIKKINGMGDIDYTDLFAFNPSDSAHRACLSFNYADVMAAGGYASQVHAGASDTDVNASLDTVFGSVLSFLLPDNLNSEVQVRLAVFGRGKVQSDDGLLVMDSEANASNHKTVAMYPRDRETPVTFTATPLTDTKILGWTGCDQVSNDQKQCQAGLSTNRQVQANFGYGEAVIAPKFIDLRLATVTRSGDILTVVVDEKDIDLLVSIYQISPGYYVAGMSDQGPFLLLVTEVLGNDPYNTFTLKTAQASLEDVLLQGTGVLRRALTHGDLTKEAYTLQMHSATGEVLPVRLVPSSDPDDRVFRIQVGNVPETKDTRVSGDLVIKEDGVEIRLHGEADVTIDLDTGVSYGMVKGLEYFKFVPRVGIKEAFQLTATGKLKGEKRKNIYTIPFAAIMFMVGPVPVWVSPTVDIVLGVESSLEGTAGIAISFEIAAAGGVQYTAGQGWEPIVGFDRSWEVEEPKLDFPGSVGGSVNGFVSAEPKMTIYSLSGPELAIEPYLRGSVTGSLDPSCKAALDWGLWGGITGKLQWKGEKSTPILGKALGEMDLTYEFYNWDRKILGGVLNGCGDAPPALGLTGKDISKNVILGSGGNLQTTYTLGNLGNQDMPWSISKPAFSPVSVTPLKGTLSPGATKQVTVTVNSPGALNLGSHTYRLVFNNEFEGPIGQSGLGSQDRNVRVTVLPEALPAPTLTVASRYTETTAMFEWTFPAASQHLLSGFNIWYTTDETFETGWIKAAIVDRNQYSMIVQGLPKKTVYATVEAFGAYPEVQTAFSEYKTLRPWGESPFATWTNSLGMTFVLLPPGTFTMGSPDDEYGRGNYEGPQHQVTLTQPFYMQQTEMTHGQWAAVMGGGDPSCPTCPVGDVSYDDIQDFISVMNALGEGTYNLPTEAQWEYAIRAGTTTPFYNGHFSKHPCFCNYDPRVNAIAWYCYSGGSPYWENGERPRPVAQKAPNPWGLYDMSGNVAEFVRDFWSFYSAAAQTDPTGPANGYYHIIRNGTFGAPGEDCRSAERGAWDLGNRSPVVGFRLMRQP